MARQKQQPQAEPTANPDCPDCKLPLRPADCFCASCRSYWAYQTLHRGSDTWRREWGREPERGCPVCGQEVSLDGYCKGCDDFRAPRLDHQAYSNRAFSYVVTRWKETYQDRRCTKEENLAHLRELRKMLAGKGGLMSRAMLASLDTVPF